MPLADSPRPEQRYVSPVYELLKGDNRRIDEERPRPREEEELRIAPVEPSFATGAARREERTDLSPSPNFTQETLGAGKTLVSTPSGPPATLRMVGFRLLPQAARISLTMSSPVGVGYEWTDPQTVVFRFKPALIQNRLLLYPLQTEAFNTSVMRVIPDWTPSRKEIKLTVRLREAVPFRLLTEGGTYHLDFKR